MARADRDPDRDEAPDWAALADRLDALAADLEAAAPAAPGELDDEIVTLWARTLRHHAIQLRQFEA
jgi:hypothetical protein